MDKLNLMTKEFLENQLRLSKEQELILDQMMILLQKMKNLAESVISLHLSPDEIHMRNEKMNFFYNEYLYFEQQLNLIHH